MYRKERTGGGLDGWRLEADEDLEEVEEVAA